MASSRMAREFAAEIRLQDSSDAPYRADRAGHDRERDYTRTKFLTENETNVVRMNVMWVTAQVLGHDDSNLTSMSSRRRAGSTHSPRVVSVTVESGRESVWIQTVDTTDLVRGPPNNAESAQWP